MLETPFYGASHVCHALHTKRTSVALQVPTTKNTLQNHKLPTRSTDPRQQGHSSHSSTTEWQRSGDRPFGCEAPRIDLTRVDAKTLAVAVARKAAGALGTAAITIVAA